MLLGEEADETAPTAFIRGGDKAVQDPMLLGRLTVGVLLAGEARAGVDLPPLGSLDHGPLPPLDT
jgi:hypothetical protein